MFLAVVVYLVAEAVAENVSDGARVFRPRGNGVRDTGRRLSDGQTSLTATLNDQIAASPDWGSFRGGGKGILIRSPDFVSWETKVVPATFWSNDIFAPSGVYPKQDPWCPMYYDDDGYGSGNEQCKDEKGEMGLCADGKWTGSWGYAQTAYVIGSSMRDVFQDYDHIQSDDWGWGVFYPTDSNAADKRCRFYEDYKGWDCPGGWVNEDGSFTADPEDPSDPSRRRHGGAGYYEPGNPDAGYGGGGAGCHFEPADGVIDQDDAWAGGDAAKNLVQDGHCQCNYIFKDNWDHWAQTWMAGRDTSKYRPSWNPGARPWFEGGQRAPGYAVDIAACWTNNPTDMIGLQNAIWAAAGDWSNQRAPLSDWRDPAVDGDVAASVHNRVYWGWNEIPVGSNVEDPLLWDAVMIKLPANVCEDDGLGGADFIDCLPGCAQQQLENDLDEWVNSGKLLLGEGSAGSRPGSSVVIAREYYDSSTGRYQRWFFCEDWASPSGKYQIRYDPNSNDDCFLDCYPDPC